MALKPFPFFLFRLFLFQDPLRRIRQHHDRTGQYRRIFYQYSLYLDECQQIQLLRHATQRHLQLIQKYKMA